MMGKHHVKKQETQSFLGEPNVSITVMPNTYYKPLPKSLSDIHY